MNRTPLVLSLVFLSGMATMRLIGYFVLGYGPDAYSTMSFAVATLVVASLVLGFAVFGELPQIHRPVRQVLSYVFTVALAVSLWRDFRIGMVYLPIYFPDNIAFFGTMAVVSALGLVVLIFYKERQE